MNEALQPYPYEATENQKTVEYATEVSLVKLLETPLFASFDASEILYTFETYYSFAENLFVEEEKLRQQDTPGANLYYHGIPHAISQVTYDAVSITRAIIERDDAFSRHLTAEGAIAIILGALFHDIGYVSEGRVDNYAARTQIHVEESMNMLSSTIDLLGLPASLDWEKVKNLGRIGIHGTHFLFTRARSEDKPSVPSRLEEAKKLVQQNLEDTKKFMQHMTPEEQKEALNEERKEAQIVRLAVQFADLGGQCARPDYFPEQVRNLREEMNGANPGLGTLIVGEEHELETKREYFINNFVEKAPPAPRTKRIIVTGKEMFVPEKALVSQAPKVGITVRAFFGEEKSKPFLQAWKGKAA